jgi:hypothetical protein
VVSGARLYCHFRFKPLAFKCSCIAVVCYAMLCCAGTAPQFCQSVASSLDGFAVASAGTAISSDYDGVGTGGSVFSYLVMHMRRSLKKRECKRAPAACSALSLKQTQDMQ